MSDDIRRAFDEMTEEPHPALRASLRNRLAGGLRRAPSTAGRLVAAVTVVGIVVLAAFGGYRYLLARAPAEQPGPAGGISSPSPSSSPPSTPIASPSPTWSAILGAPFTCGDLSGGTQGASAEVTDVRAGSSTGYDRLVIQFSGPVPAYTITRQSSSEFTADASGQHFTLQGSGGVRIVVHGAAAMNQTWPVDDRPGYPELKEARQMGAFEGVFSWGVGVAAPDGGCLRTTVLTGADRLVVDFQQP